MDQYRREFPLLQSCTYLDNASQGPLPVRSVEAIRAAVEKRANPTLFGLDDAFDLPRKVRALVARLIHAKPESICLTHSTGHGINIAANCLDLHPGDKVLLVEKEFPSNVYPWLNLKRRGVEVQFLSSRGSSFDIGILEKAIDARSRVLALSFVQFHNGFRHDLEALGQICRENGLCFFVDGSQAIGAIEIDVNKVPVDMLASCAAKWLLSPMGAGFLYVSEALLHHINPDHVGWLSFLGEPAEGIFERLTQYDFHLPSDATKFEVGSPLFLPLSGFQSSLELILEVGVERIERHVQELLDHLLDFLQPGKIPVASSLDPRHRSTILSLAPPEVHSLHQKLRQHQVITSVREGALRISPHFYNSVEDMDRLIEVLEQV